MQEDLRLRRLRRLRRRHRLRRRRRLRRLRRLRRRRRRCRRRRRLHVLTFMYQEGLTLTDVAAAAGKVEGVPFQTIDVER